ncbi:MAG TPA: GPR1/FUN34/YaaH family transporter [Candidatus Sulfotelmatobacter sp.]|nr:GPR1/FUN34/YaaH family transporter [Candidatus Sulfotelmatobacter sp.]
MTNSVVPMPSSQGEGRPATRAYAPVVLPSILGLYAFAAGTFIVAARMAHWYGNTQSAIVLFPLVLILGGLAQFYAGAWAFRANDAVAVAMHGRGVLSGPRTEFWKSCTLPAASPVRKVPSRSSASGSLRLRRLLGASRLPHDATRE